MAISEERIDELLEIMLDNADEDGWCHVPDGLTEEEQEEISRRLAIITMQERIDLILEGILNVIKYMDDIQKHIGKYETMDIIKIKGGLSTIKEDAQGILMDLYSEDIVADFFRIEMVQDEDIDEVQSEKVKVTLAELAKGEFKEELERVKGYCGTIIEMSDVVMAELKGE